MQIPDFNILGELGKGGMATVYLAEQISLSRKVAIKLIAPHLANETFMQRFLNEGRIIANLEHPHIVTIYDLGHVNDQAYIAMELVRGGDLTQRIKERNLDIEQSLHITKILCEVLGFSHKHGFVHRDIKPSNILFRDDRDPVLTDFGIAKEVGEDKHLTKTGVTVGTPNYMSPEQALGKKVDGRSDLYSLGIMLYEMLTMELPFKAENSVAMALMHVTGTVPPLPPHLSFAQKVIDKVLTKNPDERYQNAKELYTALDKLPTTPEEAAAVLTQEIVARNHTTAAKTNELSSHQNQATQLTQPASTEKVPAPPSHGRFWIIIGLLLSAILTGSGYFFWWQPQQALQVALARAEQQIERRRFLSPPGNNAYQSYQQALATDSQNKIALAGIQRLILLLQNQARQQREQGQLEDSLVSISQGLKIEASHPELLRLQTKVRQEVAQATARRNIADLIARARQQRKNGLWVSPKKDNALATYQEILSKDGNNEQAKAGLQAIAHHFQTLAATRQAAGQYAQSLPLIQFGLQADPSAIQLLALQAKAKRALSTTPPSPPSPPLTLPTTTRKQKEVERLLSQASRQLRHGRLSGSKGALALYRKVLHKDKNNSKALAGVEAIADRYVTLAKAQRKKNPAKALTLLTKGLAIRPNDRDWQDLRRELTAMLRKKKEQANVKKAEQQASQREPPSTPTPPPPKPVASGSKLIGIISAIDKEWGFVTFRLDASAAVKVGGYIYTKGSNRKRFKISRISDRNISANPTGGIGGLRVGMKLYSK